MKNTRAHENDFEQGPIRPPSEAKSLFLRINRNCAWNRCAFCPVYQKEAFSLRPPAEVVADIRMLAECGKMIRAAEKDGPLLWDRLYPLQVAHPEMSPLAFSNMYRWMGGKTGRMFLQDASVFSTPFHDLAQILQEMKGLLAPSEITAYAHARDVLQYNINELREIRALGLGQVHMGIESGHEKVLLEQKKGATRAEMIEAVRRCKDAGIRVCVYIMPGLGGVPLMEENARDTASAVEEMAPDMVRLRTFQLLPGTKIWDVYESGEFAPLGQIDTIREIALFLRSLDDVKTTIVSDHTVNILETIAGTWPKDREAIQKEVETFLQWDIDTQTAFIIGKRAGIVRYLKDLDRPKRKEKIDTLMKMWQVTPHNLDAVSFEMLRQYMS